MCLDNREAIACLRRADAHLALNEIVALRWAAMDIGLACGFLEGQTHFVVVGLRICAQRIYVDVLLMAINEGVGEATVVLVDVSVSSGAVGRVVDGLGGARATAKHETTAIGRRSEATAFRLHLGLVRH